MDNTILDGDGFDSSGSFDLENISFNFTDFDGDLDGSYVESTNLDDVSPDGLSRDSSLDNNGSNINGTIDNPNPVDLDFIDMRTPTGDNEQAISNAPPIRRRKKISVVWKHFTVQAVSSVCSRAYCKQCKKSFAYSTGAKLAGTSHLKRHLAPLGICSAASKNMEDKQASPHTQNAVSSEMTTKTVPRKRYRASPGLGGIPFDRDRSNHELAKMVIMQNLPLNIAEQPGFINFIRSLQPQFGMVRVGSIEADCVGIYQREKQILLDHLSRIPGRVSLSVDLWSSDQTISYAVITGHFLDGDWKLNRRILSVVTIPFLNSGTSCGIAVANCINSWNLDGKVFTVTVDKTAADDTVRDYVRGLLATQNRTILRGQLLIGNCYSLLMGRLAQEALGSVGTIVVKIRESVKYVNSSEDMHQNFVELRRQLRNPSMKSLIIDDVTKWDTTYEMLVAASELKNVFAFLNSSDPNYKETLSVDEWRQVETLSRYLKLIYEATNIMKAAYYPTTNRFYHELWVIQFELGRAITSEDPFVRNLIIPLKVIFNEYWNATYLVMAVAVMMDPRYKLLFVEFSLKRIYGENAHMWIKTVKDGAHELFTEYMVSVPAPTFFQEGNDIVDKDEMESFLSNFESLHSNSDNFSDLDLFFSGFANEELIKSELDQYLEEPVLPRQHDFDILGWWKENRLIYPTLSRMAADLLMVPFSTLEPDAVFNTGSGKMSSYQGSLKPTTLEALICAKNWLQ